MRIVELTGFYGYIKVKFDVDGVEKSVKIPGEMLVTGYVLFKSAIKEWLDDDGKSIGTISKEEKEEIIKKLQEKSSKVFTFE